MNSCKSCGKRHYRYSDYCLTCDPGAYAICANPDCKVKFRQTRSVTRTFCAICHSKAKEKLAKGRGSIGDIYSV